MGRTRETPEPRRSGRKNNVDYSNRLVASLDPASDVSEAYRVLRANLLYAFAENPPRTIMFTSPGFGEGKSVTCANLGVSLAYADKSVLIVDCDLRSPMMHKIFDKGNTEGLVNILVGERSLQEVRQQYLSRLGVVTAGSDTPNPAELLDSGRFTEFLATARKEYDYVLLDAPSMESVSDPVILASRTDGVLIVVDVRNTRKTSLRQTMRGLEAVGASVLGTIMNKVEASKSDHSYT